MSKFRSAAGVATDDREPTLPLKRVPATGKMTGIVTTLQIHELWTHFHRGRTIGCTRPNCPGCRNACAQRYEGYCGFFNPSNKNHVILGLTVGAVRQIVDQIGRLDKVRGLILQAHRSSSRMNARVVVECKAFCTDMSALPAPFNALEHLSRTFGIEAAEDALNTANRIGETSDHSNALQAQESVESYDLRWTVVDPIGSKEIDGQMHFPVDGEIDPFNPDLH